jgi:acyl-CoA thioester hydrolase
MPAEFTMKRTVQFAETDMAGVMHFANYFRIMEEVEHAFWRSLGMSVHMIVHEPEFGWPRVKVTCEYFAPARFEDELDVRLRVARIGEKSAEFEIEFTRDGKRLAQGRTTAVCCALDGRGSFQAIEIPPQVREKLAGGATQDQSY